MQNIAMLFCTGCDGAGGNTYAEQIVKLKSAEIKIDVYIYDKYMFGYSVNNTSERRNEKFIFYNDYKKLYKMIKGYDVVCVINPPMAKDINLKIYYKMLYKLECKKIYIMITRASVRVVKSAIISEEHLALFDAIFVFVSEESGIYKYLNAMHKNIISVDTNFFEYEDIKPIPYLKKKNIISYFGRFANCKGYHKIIKYYSENPIPENIGAITIEGGLYSYKNGRLRTSIGILCVLCSDIKKKMFLNNICAHENYDNYYEDMKDKMVNVYPVYNSNDIEYKKRVRKAMFALFPTEYKDDKNFGHFKHAMEYTWLECIKYGTPIITTMAYAKDFEVKVGERLIDADCGIIIINDFSEIQKLIEEYSLNYDVNVAKMQKFFKENYTNEIKLTNFINKVNEV